MIRVAHIIAPGTTDTLAKYVTAHSKYRDRTRFDCVIAAPDESTIRTLNGPDAPVYKGWPYCYGAVHWADIVNIHWQRSNYSLLKLIQALGKPHVITSYGGEQIPLIPAITIHASCYARQTQQNKRRRIFIPTGLDLTRFKPPQERQHADNVIVTRINSPDDGNLYSWLSLYRALRQHPQARLWVVGSVNAPDQNFNQINFIDGQQDIVETFAHSDIFFCDSSNGSNAGLNVMMALAMGLPCIATDTAAIRSLIQDGKNGFLVPPGDQAALIGRVEALIQNSELREKMGAAARETAEAQLDMKQVAPDYEAVYQGILAAYAENTAVDDKVDESNPDLKALARNMMREILQEKNTFAQKIIQMSNQIQADFQPDQTEDVVSTNDSQHAPDNNVFAPVPMLNAFRSAPVSSPTGESRLDHVTIFYKMRDVIGEPTGLIARKLVRENSLRQQCLDQQLQMIAEEFQEFQPSKT